MSKRTKNKYLSEVFIPKDQAPIFEGFGYMDLNTATDQEKINDFFDKFSAPKDDRDKYQPVFLANMHSCSGEVAESFGLFVLDNHLYEVNGSECSVWDFNGQWEPELTSLAVLNRRINVGTLGLGDSDNDDSDLFSFSLKECLSKIEESTNTISSVVSNLNKSSKNRF